MDNNCITVYIGSPDCFEVEYCKKDLSTSILHISDIKISEKYGEEYISAFCHESESEITLKISRINHISPHWVVIMEEGMLVPKDGLYVFACLGDMHIEHVMFMMSKGQYINEYFNGEDAPSSGFCPLLPVAYHYVCPSAESFCLFNNHKKNFR